MDKNRETTKVSSFKVLARIGSCRITQQSSVGEDWKQELQEMSVKIFMDKVLDATAESPNNSLKICSKISTASCCVLISKDALPDFLREFVREVKENDGSTLDFEESNFAMTRREPKENLLDERLLQ